MNKRALRADSEGFSLVSMTDIVFLLAMFFIVLSTYVVTGGVKVSLPSAKARDIERAVTSVSITRDGRYFVDRDEVAGPELEKVLMAKEWVQKYKSFVIRADRDAPVQSLVFVLEIASRNQLKTSLATIHERGG